MVCDLVTMELGLFVGDGDADVCVSFPQSQCIQYIICRIVGHPRWSACMCGLGVCGVEEACRKNIPE